MNEVPEKSEAAPHQDAGVLATLRVRPFAFYVLCNSIFMTGTWMQRLGVGWLTWQLTESETWLGLISACEFLPAILLGPFAGLLADRVKALPVVLIGNATRLLQAILLTIVGFSGLASPEVLLALMVLAGIASGTTHPSRLSLVSNLVPRHVLSTAVPIDSLGYNVARFLGPAIGGVILLHAPLPTLFLINVFCFVPLVGLLAWYLRRGLASNQAPAQRSERKSVWLDLKEGFLYVMREPRLAPVVALLAISSIFIRPVVDMLPAFVDTILKAGPSELATLVSAYGIGSMIAGLSVTLRHGRGSLELWHLAGAFLAIVATALFVQSGQILYATIFALLSGAGITVLSIAGQTILQVSAQGAYRGRVMSLYSMVFLGGPAIGAPLIGFLAERVGLPNAFEAGITLNVVVWVFVVISWIRLTRRNRRG